MSPTIISITNQKGGVGKTTTACALLSSLHNRGAKVLGVDLDPQGSLSFSLGLDIEHCVTIYDVFRGTASPEQAVSPTDTCDLLPANILLSAAELEFQKPGREFLLKTALSKLQDRYDFIIIDCPPSLGLLNTNALTAADSVMIPVQCEYYALEGVTQLLLTIRLVQQLFNPDLMIEGVLLTMYDARTKLSVAGQIGAWLWVALVILVAVGVPYFSIIATSLIKLRGYGLAAGNFTLDHYKELLTTPKALQRQEYRVYYLQTLLRRCLA